MHIDIKYTYIHTYVASDTSHIVYNEAPGLGW